MQTSLFVSAEEGPARAYSTQPGGFEGPRLGRAGRAVHPGSHTKPPGRATVSQEHIAGAGAA